MSLASFATLGLPSSLLEAIEAQGFTRMTETQAQTLPALLAGEDLVIEAAPGSGKTIAFGLGMLVACLPHLPPAPPEVRALAICPTRELAEQIADEVRKLARRTPNVKVLALSGGVPFAPQRASLRQGAHVVIGTPGRLEEHLRKGSLQLERLKVLVLDEADRMLSMGFAPQLEAVVAYAPRERQTLLCSATMPESITELCRHYQQQARRITIAPASVPAPAMRASDIDGAAGMAAAGPDPATGKAESVGSLDARATPVEQRFYRVAVAQRPDALLRWLDGESPAATLVFCNTRAECRDLALALRQRGWVAAAIHGEMSQRERTHVMRLFSNGSCSVLTATDIAARGWDIEGLPAIVNVGLSRDPSVHVHRLGRTGRAGQPGLAAHFIAEEDLGALGAIERDQRFTAAFLELPAAAASPATPPLPPMVSIVLSAGKNKKLRPGDILGALTVGGDVRGEDVGAIHIDDSSALVAVRRAVADVALARLGNSPVKGRVLRATRAAPSLRDDG